jgi:hypothetical protein
VPEHRPVRLRRLVEIKAAYRKGRGTQDRLDKVANISAAQEPAEVRQAGQKVSCTDPRAIEALITALPQEAAQPSL